MSPAHPIVETPASENWIEDGILFSRAKDRAYIDLEQAKQITRAFQQLTDEALPLLVDLHTIQGQSVEAREYFGNDPVHLKTLIAVALVVRNPVAKIIANFFLGLNKPQRPTRLFTNFESALAWLRSPGHLEETG